MWQIPRWLLVAALDVVHFDDVALADELTDDCAV